MDIASKSTQIISIKKNIVQDIAYVDNNSTYSEMWRYAEYLYFQHLWATSADDYLDFISLRNQYDSKLYYNDKHTL